MHLFQRPGSKRATRVARERGIEALAQAYRFVADDGRELIASSRRDLAIVNDRFHRGTDACQPRASIFGQRLHKPIALFATLHCAGDIVER